MEINEAIKRDIITFQEYSNSVEILQNRCDAERIERDNAQYAVFAAFAKKYLPTEKLHEWFPWALEKKLNSFEVRHHMYMHAEVKHEDEYQEFDLSITMYMSGSTPKLFMSISNEDIARIDLTERPDIVMSNIDHYVQIINEVRSNFIKNSKRILNL